MRYTVLGRTGLSVTRTSFGALPIQRLPEADAAQLVRAAVDAGINYIDTARDYSDSEHKLGIALQGAQDKVFIATKTSAKAAPKLWTDLATSLETLKTDHIDVYQFHNPPFVPRPGGDDGLYDAALQAKAQGKIRFIGITQHSMDRAFEAVESELYDTLQYPFNHLASERELKLVALCREKNVGFVAMKAMSGGLIADAAIPFAFISQHDNVVPIYGMQKMGELQQFMELEANPPRMDDTMRARINADRAQLAGSFCRGCGYCLPCPAGIPIQNANRMTQLLTRSPIDQWLTDIWREGMGKIEDCTQCGLCASRCPYGLKPYETLPAHLAYYQTVMEQRKSQ